MTKGDDQVWHAQTLGRKDAAPLTREAATVPMDLRATFDQWMNANPKFAHCHVSAWEAVQGVMAMLAAEPASPADDSQTIPDELKQAGLDAHLRRLEEQNRGMKSEEYTRPNGWKGNPDIAAPLPRASDAICDHEWEPMTEPHKECVKCGDVRKDCERASGDGGSCCGYTYEQCHRGPGCEFDAWRKREAASRPPAADSCATCNGHGMIGGPSFREPDEGGVPCPDCTPAAGVPITLEQINAVSSAIYHGQTAEAYRILQQMNTALGATGAAPASVQPEVAVQEAPQDCRIWEYDGAFKCMTHQNTWGAIGKPVINDPAAPCAPLSTGEAKS